MYQLIMLLRDCKCGTTGYVSEMAKRVIDLTAEELDKAAGEAWAAAAREALARGLPVTGAREGRRLRYHPDGRIEDLGPMKSHPAADEGHD